MSGKLGGAGSKSGIIGPLPGELREMGNLHNDNVVYTTTKNQSAMNISSSEYITCTPEAVTDIIEFGYSMNLWGISSHVGWGVERADNSGFTTNKATAWCTGPHVQEFASGVDYTHVGGSVNFTASELGMSANQLYYLRMIGMTGNENPNPGWDFGANATGEVHGKGIKLTVKRWKAT